MGIFVRLYLKTNAGNIGSVLLGLIISFFPKCPFCWAAYMSIFSTLGIATIPYLPWLQPLMMVIFIINIFSLFKVARRNGSYAPLALSITGVIFIVTSKVVLVSMVLTYAGLTMIIAASFWNLLTKKLACSPSKSYLTNPSNPNSR